MIKAVIFDAGDVVYYRDEETLKPLLDFFKKNKFKIPVKVFLKAYDENSLELYKGKVSKDENLKKVLKSLKITFDNNFFSQFAKIFRECFSKIKIKDDVYETFEKIKAKGLKIAILSDAFSTEEKKWGWLRGINVAQFVDVVVCSISTGHTKDEKEAYEIVLNKLGLKPNEAIFIGHKEYEMKGAKLAGVKVISLEKGIGEDIFIDDISKLAGLIK